MNRFSHLVVDMGHREFSRFEYAIMNPMRTESAYWREFKPIVLGVEVFGGDLSHLPQLITLDSLGDAGREGLLERNTLQIQRGQGALFGALLSSKRSQVDVAAHLSARMIGVASRSEKYWLRFHDPSVFDCLDRLLNDAQMHRFLGVVDCWTWFDRVIGAWRQRVKPLESIELQPARLTSEQWSALGRQRFLNKTLKLLAGETREPSDGRSFVMRIDGYVKQAMLLGLKDDDDICAFALGLERFGVHWLDKSEISEAVELARRGEQSFFRSMADLQA